MEGYEGDRSAAGWRGSMAGPWRGREWPCGRSERFRPLWRADKARWSGSWGRETANRHDSKAGAGQTKVPGVRDNGAPAARTGEEINVRHNEVKPGGSRQAPGAGELPAVLIAVAGLLWCVRAPPASSCSLDTHPVRSVGERGGQALGAGCVGSRSGCGDVRCCCAAHPYAVRGRDGLDGCGEEETRRMEGGGLVKFVANFWSLPLGSSEGGVTSRLHTAGASCQCIGTHFSVPW